MVALGLGLAAGIAGGQDAQAAQARFMSYASERDCAGSRILSPAVCRSAFSNARAEFESKTASFSSLDQCARLYGSCAAWPPGNPTRTSYRPQWSGVDIVDTPLEHTVTPAVARGSKRLSFAARALTGGDDAAHDLVVRGGQRLIGPPAAPAARSVRAARGPEPGQAIAPGRPGGGFKLENGVLTYPAPARFAPGALPKTP